VRARTIKTTSLLPNCFPASKAILRTSVPPPTGDPEPTPLPWTRRAPRLPRVTPAVRIRGLVKRYGPHEAVAGLDLYAPAGALTAQLGPNGAGKTSTIVCCE